MHGSFDSHHLGQIAFDAIQFVTRQRPEVIFRFIGKKTDALEGFLNRAQRQIPGFKFEATGFVPYAKVARHLADASVGIVPYEESAGTHCAFVAKVVEYVASGLPAVATPLKSIRRYFKMTRWCASRNSTVKISGKKSSAGSMNLRKPGRSARAPPPPASRPIWIGDRSAARPWILWRRHLTQSRKDAKIFKK